MSIPHREKIAAIGNMERSRKYRARRKGEIPDIDYHEGVQAAIAAAGLGSVRV
jgi:hypothetical protein